ncbi:hypothetical protein C8T65DRAFT_691294 [Cerioporus squamosus]|nr:hypothetical protein C8T65DRAFT_691294 [Cerioporus squamosus]
MMHMLSLSYPSANVVVSGAASPYFRAPFIVSSASGTPVPSSSDKFPTTSFSNATDSFTPSSTLSGNPSTFTDNSTSPFNGTDPFFPRPRGSSTSRIPPPGRYTFLTDIPVTNIIEVSTEIPLSTTLSASGSSITALTVTFNTTYTAVVPYATVVTVSDNATASATRQPPTRRSPLRRTVRSPFCPYGSGSEPTTTAFSTAAPTTTSVSACEVVGVQNLASSS